MTTRWANLPNAAHIDRVIALAKATPDHWRGSWSAQDETWEAVRGMVAVRVRDAAWMAAWHTSRYFAQDAILALIAYDECAYMLDAEPSELAILAALGDRRAIMLLPACKAFHSSKTNA